GDLMMWIAVDDLLLDLYSMAGRTEEAVRAGQRILEEMTGRYRLVQHSGRMADIHLRVARALLEADDPALLGHHVAEAHRLAEAMADERLSVRVAALEAQYA